MFKNIEKLFSCFTSHPNSDAAPPSSKGKGSQKSPQPLQIANQPPSHFGAMSVVHKKDSLSVDHSQLVFSVYNHNQPEPPLELEFTGEHSLNQHSITHSLFHKQPPLPIPPPISPHQGEEDHSDSDEDPYDPLPSLCQPELIPNSIVQENNTLLKTILRQYQNTDQEHLEKFFEYEMQLLSNCITQNELGVLNSEAFETIYQHQALQPLGTDEQKKVTKAFHSYVLEMMIKDPENQGIQHIFRLMESNAMCSTPKSINKSHGKMSLQIDQYSSWPW